MKLSVELLDNNTKSAVINVGKNNGYIEAFVWKGVMCLYVYNKEGDVVHNYAITIKELRLNKGEKS